MRSWVPRSRKALGHVRHSSCGERMEFLRDLELRYFVCYLSSQRISLRLIHVSTEPGP
jgi:hypothetical protein